MIPGFSTLHSPEVSTTLASLHADAAANDQRVRQALRDEMSPLGDRHSIQYVQRHLYMAVPPEFGKLLYAQTRLAGARTVVEFGTSFGVSTIYLAAAIRDNGGGRVITTEIEPEKAELARRNLEAAGLADFVDFRVGDALESLANSPGSIDVLFLDGAKELYLDVLRRVESRLRSGAVVLSDNTDHEGLEGFLEHIRTPAKGYTSSAILTATSSGKGSRGHEITIRH